MNLRSVKIIHTIKILIVDIEAHNRGFLRHYASFQILVRSSTSDLCGTLLISRVCVRIPNSAFLLSVP